MVVIPAYVATILPARFSLSSEIFPPFEEIPSGRTNIVPVAVGDNVLIPRLASNDVKELILVTTNDPLY